MSSINFETIYQDFPVLLRELRGKPIVYLDNGASTQKPKRVIERVRHFDSYEYANVRRGSYSLGDQVTHLYEDVRKKIARFINAGDEKEIIFTSGTTQGINLVAFSFAKRFIKKGDEIIISNMEHHANIIPWQIVCEEREAILKIVPIADDGELMMDEYEKLLSEKTKLVAITHVSNVLGTINPIKKIVEMGHSVGAKVLIDGAQGAPHTRIDVSDVNCDFYVFSGHKIYAPTGIGVLYGRYNILNELPPYVTGGDMINTVSFEKTTYAKPPARFEAGTPPISQVIGLGEALDYLSEIGLDKIEEYEKSLLNYGTKLLEEIPGLTIIGKAKEKGAILSFLLKDIHPHDVVTLLDQDAICIRGGHHCAQPLMKRYKVPATSRASLSFYNRKSDLDALANGLKKVIEVFK